jgi:hypothetical protein
VKVVEDTDLKIWYTSTKATKNELDIMINKSLKDGVVDIKWRGEMIILVKLLIGDLGF